MHSIASTTLASTPFLSSLASSEGGFLDPDSPRCVAASETTSDRTGAVAARALTTSPNPGNLGQQIAYILGKKVELKDKELEVKGDTKLFTANNVFTSLYLTFRIALAFFSEWESTIPMLFVIPAAGLITGGLNMLEGGVSFWNGLKAISKGERGLGFRMIWDGFWRISLGLVLICVSLLGLVGVKGAALSFISNPYTLPIIFFLVAIPLIRELIKNYAAIFRERDLGSQLNLKTLKEQLQQNPPSLSWNTQEKEIESGKNYTQQQLSDLMEKYQDGPGVEVAIEVFTLWKLIEEYNVQQENKNTQQILEQIQKLEQAVDKKHHFVRVKLWQQTLFALFSALAIGGLGASLGDENVEKGLNAAALLVNLFMIKVASYVDLQPFQRGNGKIVGSVNVQETVHSK